MVFLKIFSKCVTAPPSDFELMSSMMQKIVQLERKVKTQAVDIEQKVKGSFMFKRNLLCCIDVSGGIYNFFRCRVIMS